ncbi:MAG: hypothetical protein JWQ21_578 [Herminiimonas sp.]|nr:hypothetical protein [Herminiimonas sp.]
MAYRANPFLERMSERTTSDQDFVRLFSPKILEQLQEDAFEGAVHLFTSPPGGGKTTLLRALTPTALRAFWNNRTVPDMNESYRRLAARGIFHDQEGPQLLGVFLSCASGYADLPPGASMAQEGLFRALFDCRVVLRSLRSLASLLGFGTTDQLVSVKLEYAESAKDLKSIPLLESVPELIRWAEEQERKVYARLDAIINKDAGEMPVHVRFESVLWLQAVRFIRDGRAVAPTRLLMVDDLHALRKKQRELLMRELVELRPLIPVWLAERSIALGDTLISQGAREGRDLRHCSLEGLWSTPRGQHQFCTFAQNILDRRLDVQHVIPGGAFAQYLRDQFTTDELRDHIAKGVDTFRAEMQRHQSNPRYSEWMARAERGLTTSEFESLRDLYVTRILVARDESKRQLTLELAPLSSDELDERDSSQVQSAAEIFANEDIQVPYYFGVDRLCAMGSSNVEEVLFLAASLYEGMKAKQILRKQPDPQLSPQDQERRIKEAAKRKRDFIHKNHTEGSRAQRLLDAIGVFCRGKTFQPNAPYAPGVTGVRLGQAELNKLAPDSKPQSELAPTLQRVLSECVAENLLVARPSQASVGREGGTVFYLNRILCAHYGLPLQYGGWQETSVDKLIEWMERGLQPSRQRRLEG